MYHQLRDGSMCLGGPEAPGPGWIGVPDIGHWLDQAAKWFEGYHSHGWEMEPFEWSLIAPLRPAPGYRPILQEQILCGLPPAWQKGPPGQVGRIKMLVPKDKRGLAAVVAWQGEDEPSWTEWHEASDLVDERRDLRIGIWMLHRDPISLAKGRMLGMVDSDCSLGRRFRKLLERVGKEGIRLGQEIYLAVGGPSLWGDPGIHWSITPDIRHLISATAQEIFGPLANLKAESDPIAGLAQSQFSFPAQVLSTSTLDARRQMSRTAAMNEALNSTQIILCGLGALGSEVAHLLAQEGIGRFMLCDADILLPGNVARHRANLSDAGRLKAEAVARDIHRVNPHAKVDAVKGWLEELVPLLRVPRQQHRTIAVGLTGDEASEHALGDACTELGISCFHAWLEHAGQVLRLFRVIHGRDPSLLALATAPSNPVPPIPKSELPALAATECAEVVLPGAAVTVHAAANFVAQAVLDAAIGHHPAENHWLLAPNGLSTPSLPAALLPLRNRFGLCAFTLRDDFESVPRSL